MASAEYPQPGPLSSPQLDSQPAGELARHGRRLDSLLDQLRRQGERADGPARVVSWLAAQLTADLALTVAPVPGTRAGGAEPAAGPEAWAPAGADQRLAGAAPAVARLLGGDPAGAEDAELRLVPLGGRPPRAVLALRRAEPLTALEVRLIEHTGTVLLGLLAARESAADRATLHEVSASLRVAAFQLLMGGQITLARRTAAPLVPGVLVHDTARVFLVDCARTDRDATAALLAEAVPGRALIVRCPANDHHLIVLAPMAPDTALDQQGWCPTGLRLREVVEARPDHRIGGSSTVVLAHTADAYQEAFNALTVARGLPQRHALYQSRTPLAQLLGADGQEWAEQLLRPLLELPRDQRDEVIETTRLALGFSNGQTGRLLGVHRNTVTRRIERVGRLLCLDWGSFADRALLDLALQLLTRDTLGGPPGAVRLEAILGSPAARAWARAFLAPLEEDRRRLLGTLAAWVAAGANARDTRVGLGLHHQTVLDHLRTAERLLQRELTAGRTGAYELAWALWISAAVELPPEPGCQAPSSAR
ncbi:helix-turn-helix domain-containing protein [Kitasatospora sp. NPDC006697]|uniref:helix-turn-helix domain-containing protein n=1 Tax=Kitasatospora sp. NPDC006697 TaxID=3364020 RepID=UPI0036BFD7CD